MHEAIDRLQYLHTGSFTHDAMEELADALLEDAPGDLSHAFFVSSGSEAVESALKLARQYFLEIGQPERYRFVARRQSYHGNTLGALAVGGNAMRQAPYKPLLMDAASHIAPCYAYRDQRDDETLEAYGLRVANELETELLRLGPETVAAFIAEPVVGATLGSAPPAPGYFRRIREICDQYGVLFIADEIMCGGGRCGAMFAISDEGVAPDIITVAKGLGGGYQPIGGDALCGPYRGCSQAWVWWVSAWAHVSGPPHRLRRSTSRAEDAPVRQFTRRRIASRSAAYGWTGG